jgi:glycosyltransferase involved in cell wall biosynthesis
MSSLVLPKITIITPSYQQASFLERTIRSVLDQNYPFLEYMVIDGASTDGSVGVIKRFEDRIAWWVSEKDNGQSDAINKGLARATGDIVGWINSDDTMAPGSLHAIGSYYAAHPDCEFLYGHTNLIDADDRVIRRLIAVPANAHDLITYNRNLFSQPGTTWKRSLMEKTGPLDQSLHYTMDCDFYIRAAKVARLHMIPRHLANLRIHGQTKSNTMRDKMDAEQHLLDSRYGTEIRSGPKAKLFNLRRRLRILARPSNWSRLLGR